MRFAIFAAVVCALGSSLMADIASNYVTFPMDGQYDWFQNGVYAANPGAGLPNPGIIAGQSEPASTFLLQPYTGKNVLLIKSPSAVDNGVQTGTMTFATPTPALSLALATSSGFGPNTIDGVVHFADGTQDFPFSFISPDWLLSGNGEIVTTSVGRVLNTGSLLSSSSYQLNSYHIMQVNIGLPGTTAHPISSVDFTYVSTTSVDNTPYHETAIFGISTSPVGGGPYTAAQLTPASFNQDVVVEVPEPVSLGIVLLAPLALLRRRG